MRDTLTPPESTSVEFHTRLARVFGLDYTHITIPETGDLYVTPFGKPYMDHLLPSNWDNKEYYSRPENKPLRTRLKGTAYPHRITTMPVHGRSIDIVVKWCRVGKDVHLDLTGVQDTMEENLKYSAQWNSPFEEFGLVMELRNVSRYYDHPLLTQRPLAIYTPFEKAKSWETGRRQATMMIHRHQLQKDQQTVPEGEAIDLDVHRLYAMIYGWVEGEDAAMACAKGRITQEEADALTQYVNTKVLNNCGYRVLDSKPAHLITRARGNDVLRDHKGRIVFALIDFELLQRTRAYEKIFRRAQRARYWNLLLKRDERTRPLPRGYEAVHMFDVDYVCAETSNQGRLWVVGKQGDLIEYFDTPRWRRSPRIQLSATTFRTISLDNIHLVYKHSHVGMRPQQDPSTEKGRRARAFGFNSPFEEFAIAEDLRKLGIRTVYPRAIYRTAHESLPAEWLQDGSRYISHQKILLSDGTPVLERGHDYYLLWGCWRGIDVATLYDRTEHCGFIDAVQAFDEGMVSPDQYNELVTHTKERLYAIGFAGQIRTERIVLTCVKGDLVCDNSGLPIVTLSINGYRAFELDLVSLEEYERMVARKRKRLEKRGYTPYNLKGDHLLLSIDPDGVVQRDTHGNIETVLCNFEEIRAPWMNYEDPSPVAPGNRHL